MKFDCKFRALVFMKILFIQPDRPWSHVVITYINICHRCTVKQYAKSTDRCERQRRMCTSAELQNPLKCKQNNSLHSTQNGACNMLMKTSAEKNCYHQLSSVVVQFDILQIWPYNPILNKSTIPQLTSKLLGDTGLFLDGNLFVVPLLAFIKMQIFLKFIL